jgi:hypothetical protein
VEEGDTSHFCTNLPGKRIAAAAKSNRLSAGSRWRIRAVGDTIGLQRDSDRRRSRSAHPDMLFNAYILQSRSEAL